MIAVSIFGWPSSSWMVTNAGLDKTPSSCLARRLRRQNQNTIICLALNQRYLTTYISVWSSSSDRPRGLEENYPLVEHTHFSPKRL